MLFWGEVIKERGAGLDMSALSVEDSSSGSKTATTKENARQEKQIMNGRMEHQGLERVGLSRTGLVIADGKVKVGSRRSLSVRQTGGWTQHVTKSRKPSPSYQRETSPR